MASPAASLAPAPTLLDDANTWRNLSSWINVTRYAPSIEDLVLAGPRMLTRLGSIISFPDALDGVGQRVIADPTGSTDYLLTTTPGAAEMAATAADVTSAAAGAVDIAFDADQDPTAFVSRFSMESARGLTSVFGYATSKWALCCVAMAIILNRTHIFAASRRRLRLTWHIRLALRFIPILLFGLQCRQLLQSIQCQTSPQFAEMRWGNSTKTSDLMFAHAGGYLHGVSSTLLMRADDYDSCRAVSMVPTSPHEFSEELRGSLSRLWPLFGTLCLSHFTETISCAVQGRTVAVETGMTLFEHSLAFAEADAAVSNQLGLGFFSSGNDDAQQSSGPGVSVSRSMIMRRVNTPPEVLLVAFLSAMSHVTSHILGVFGLQSRFRLVNTGFWALCFMASIVYEAYSFSLDEPSRMGLFRFPTVCIIGFIPHVMVLGGISVCAFIYGLALFLSAIDPPEQPSGQRSTFRQRLVQAHSNMQANISLSDIRITREMDFYTALLRTGFGVITMASEAVYLNQDRHVNLKEHTWLEDERYKELDEMRMQWAGSGVDSSSRFDSVGAIGLVPVKESQIGLSNGFARERAAQKIPKGRMGDRRARDGVGASERSSRWVLALDFLMRIFRLVGRWGAALTLKALSRIGISRRPRFLFWLAQYKTPSKDDRQQARGASGRSRARPVLIRDGVPIFGDENTDIEVEMRKRFKKATNTANISEQEFDSRLYSSWKHGGMWGGVDTSGEWEPEPNDDDWDTTSLIHSVVDEDESLSDRDGWIDEDEDEIVDGQRTPTQRSPQFSRESTPLDQPVDMNDLARLLHPKSPEDRSQAHALAAHLNSDRIMTRSAFARQQQAERGHLLTSALKHRQHAGSAHVKMSPEEEAELLEQLILTRRVAASAVADASDSPESEGPQCVVCQCSSRTIIVWPCRCLSLCDDCRVSLAMNNFDKCVCCRREVISFSRIYVP